MGNFVDQKMAEDPTYAPYCMRCTGIRRMDRLSPSIAQCPACGACHDTRRATPAPTYTPESVRALKCPEYVAQSDALEAFARYLESLPPTSPTDL